MSTKIYDLMEVPIEENGLEWLRESLQAAIELEFIYDLAKLCHEPGKFSGDVRAVARRAAVPAMGRINLAFELQTNLATASF